MGGDRWFWESTVFRLSGEPLPWHFCIALSLLDSPLPSVFPSTHMFRWLSFCFLIILTCHGPSWPEIDLLTFPICILSTTNAFHISQCKFLRKIILIVPDHLSMTNFLEGVKAHCKWCVLILWYLNTFIHMEEQIQGLPLVGPKCFHFHFSLFSLFLLIKKIVHNKIKI